MRRGCTVPSQLAWPSTKKSDGIEKFVTTAQWVGPSGDQVCRDTTARGQNTGFICRTSIPLCELPEIDKSLTLSRLLGLHS